MSARQARPEVATFDYHEVTDDPRTSGLQRLGAMPYKLTAQAFARHLAEMATSPVIPELVDAIDLTGPGRHLLLTFDDGGKSAVYASEELSRRGWKAHFFIITSRIGTRTFLDASEIRYIRSQGHLVGSHSHTHPNIFKEQSFESMVREWRVSCDRLAQLLGEACRTAAVPGGDISRMVLESASAAGLSHLFTCEPRLTPERVGHCWILGRFLPKVSTPLARIRDLAHFRGWGRALLVRRLKVLGRIVAPLPYRWLVRHRTHEFPAPPSSA
jgi:peptidoglycan/xylan/chitin deacetylase (PgdA/CDA1 family)